jgi:hypothetical protein
LKTKGGFDFISCFMDDEKQRQMCHHDTVGVPPGTVEVLGMGKSAGPGFFGVATF